MSNLSVKEFFSVVIFTILLIIVIVLVESYILMYGWNLFLVDKFGWNIERLDFKEGFCLWAVLAVLLSLARFSVSGLNKND